MTQPTTIFLRRKTWAVVTLTLASLFVATQCRLFERRTIAGLHNASPLQDVDHIDCKKIVSHPIDCAPVRSPQEVHSVIAAKVFSRKIVEIGTRNGDGMACFARYASSASAIEYDENYCKKLEQRSSHENLFFEVQCQDFFSADLDADVITWWQQYPLTNAAALARLKQLWCSGTVRSTAEAILVFDMKWPHDMDDFLELKQWFSWHQEVQFDEHDRCEIFRAREGQGSKETGFSCDRSQGKFMVANIPVANVPNDIFTCSNVQ